MDPADQAIEELERRAALAREGPAAAEALVALAAALRDAGDAAAALSATRRAWRAQPERPGLVPSLLALARKQAAWADIMAVARGEDRSGRLDVAENLYRELADAADPEVAGEADTALLALLERSNRVAELAERLENRIGLRSRRDDLALHQRLAALYRDVLADGEAAARHLEHAAALSPDDVALWEDLAAVHAASGQHGAQARALEAQLSRTPDPAREIALRTQLAALCSGPLNDEKSAAAHRARLLELDPNHPQGLAGRGEEPQGRAPVALLRARLARLEAQPGEPDRAGRTRLSSLRVQLAELLRTRGEDEEARALLEAAHRDIGPHVRVSHPLADLYEAQHRDPELAALCRATAGSREDRAERGLWWRRLGHALVRMHDLDAAVSAYRAALTDRPGDSETEAALRKLYARRGEAAPLARLLDAELARLVGPEEIPLRLELAELLTGPLSGPADALLHLRRVLELAPDDAAAWERALALADRLGRSEDQLALLEHRLARVDGRAERADLEVRRGHVLARGLARPDAAITAYRAALSQAPSHPEALSSLHHLLRSLGRFEALLDCIALEVECAAPDRRAALLEEAARVAHQHVAPDAALPWLERLRSQRPTDSSVLARIAAVHRRAGRSDALLRSLEAQIECTEPSEPTHALHAERAHLLEHELHAPGLALAALEEASRARPTHGGTLTELARLYESSGRQREQASTLERMLPLTRPEEQWEVHRRLAALYLGALHEPSRAVDHLTAALERGPREGFERVGLLQSLGDALERLGRRQAWARAAEAELAALDTAAPVYAERRQHLRLALARTCAESLGRADRSLVHLRALLEDDSADRADPDTPIFEVAERELIGLLRADGAPLELERQLRRRLERRGGDADSWLELARLREEKLLDLAGAAAAYREVLTRDPASLAALRGLRRASQRLSDPEEVVRTLAAEIELRTPRPAHERAALLVRLAEVSWRQLGRTTQASRAYAAALELVPDDVSTLHGFGELLASVEDWRGVIDLLEREVAVVEEDDPARTRELWLRCADIARHRLADPERARVALEAARDVAPLPAAALHELAVLYRDAGDREAHARTLSAWCDHPEGAAEAEDHLELAEALALLGQREAAEARARQVLARRPDHLAAWDLAAQLREELGDAAGAAEALEASAEVLGKSAAAERLRRAAQLVEAQAPERAAALLAAALERDPGCAQTHALHATVCAGLGRNADAEAAAGTALRLAPGRHGLDLGLRLRTALVGARAARAAEHLEAAIGFYNQALAVDPDHAEALAEHAALLFEAGDLGGARIAAEARMNHGEEDPARARHQAIRGVALLDAGELQEALAQLDEALRSDPSLPDALGARVEVLERLGRLADAVRAAVTWARAGGNPAETSRRLLRAAQLEAQRSDGEDDQRLLQLYRTAARIDPRCIDAVLPWATDLVRRERPAEALGVIERSLAVELPETSLERLRGLEAQAAEHAGQPERAAEAWGAVLRVRPGHVTAGLARARLLRSVGRWRDAALCLEAVVAATPQAQESELAALWLQLGRLLAGPLDDPAAATAIYRRAIEVAPELGEAHEALAELLSRRSETWDEAIAAHRALLEARPTRVASIRSLLRIARGLGDEGAAWNGNAILVALGQATPGEREVGDAPLSLQVASTPCLSRPTWESIRRLGLAASREIAAALGASELSPATAGGDAQGDFLRHALSAEAEMCAPALVPLPTEEVAAVLTLIAELVVQQEHVAGDGYRVNAFANAIGRRARRRLRRILDEAGLGADAVRENDFEAWRTDLRSLACSVALDRSGGDLRLALTSLLREDADLPLATPDAHADLSACVDGCRMAEELLRRVVRSWIESIGA